MFIEFLDYLAELKVPDDNLCVFAWTCDKSIAFADIDVSNVIEVAVQRRLQGQCLSIPDFDYTKNKWVSFHMREEYKEIESSTYPSSAPLTTKRPV